MEKQSPPSPPAYSSGRAGGSRGAAGKAPLSTELPSSEPFTTALSEVYLLKRARNIQTQKTERNRDSEKVWKKQSKGSKQKKTSEKLEHPQRNKKGSIVQEARVSVRKKE